MYRQIIITRYIYFAYQNMTRHWIFLLAKTKKLWYGQPLMLSVCQKQLCWTEVDKHVRLYGQNLTKYRTNNVTCINVDACVWAQKHTRTHINYKVIRAKDATRARTRRMKWRALGESPPLQMSTCYYYHRCRRERRLHDPYLL